MSRPKIEVASYKGKRGNQWLRVLLALVVAGALTFAVLFGWMLAGDRTRVEGTPDVMVVLGCKVESWGPTALLQDRLDTALEYLLEHPDLPVIVSGGQGSNEPMSEAQAMYDVLVEGGVSPERIIREAQSTNTAENMRFSMEQWKEQGGQEGDHVLVVSNGFHLSRAKMLAERAGFGTVSTLAAPSSHAPSKMQMYLREPLALFKSLMFDH